VLLFGHASKALGQANCSLRNPDRQIYEMFPEATSYRTAEAEVNTKNRSDLEDAIGSPLAQSDLGVHSAYIVLKDKIPIGFVHARSEIGSRGSIELVWAMDIDLTITEFRIQRSREPQTKVIQSEVFQSRLVGRNLTGLKALLSNGNDEIDISALDVSTDSAAITHTAVLCALKTRVITETCFASSILSAQILSHAYSEFDDIGKLSKIKTPLANDQTESLHQKLGRSPDQLDLETIDIIRVRSQSGEELGLIIRTDWVTNPQHPDIWWAVGNDGTLQRATIAGLSYKTVQSELGVFQSMDLAQMTKKENESKSFTLRLAHEVLAIANTVGGS
jgi:hypothetical protein